MYSRFYHAMHINKFFSKNNGGPGYQIWSDGRGVWPVFREMASLVEGIVHPILSLWSAGVSQLRRELLSCCWIAELHQFCFLSLCWVELGHWAHLVHKLCTWYLRGDIRLFDGPRGHLRVKLYKEGYLWVYGVCTKSSIKKDDSWINLNNRQVSIKMGATLCSNVTQSEIEENN